MSASYRSALMGLEMILPDMPDMPEMKSIQPQRRWYRFQMAKSKMMCADRDREIKENQIQASEEREAIRAQLQKNSLKKGLTADQVDKLPPIDLDAPLQEL
eukprot:1121856-Amphidinium_carterae.2